MAWATFPWRWIFFINQIQSVKAVLPFSKLPCTFKNVRIKYQRWLNKPGRDRALPPAVDIILDRFGIPDADHTELQRKDVGSRPREFAVETAGKCRHAPAKWEDNAMVRMCPRVVLLCIVVLSFLGCNSRRIFCLIDWGTVRILRGWTRCCIR